MSAGAELILSKFTLVSASAGDREEILVLYIRLLLVLLQKETCLKKEGIIGKVDDSRCSDRCVRLDSIYVNKDT